MRARRGVFVQSDITRPGGGQWERPGGPCKSQISNFKFQMAAELIGGEVIDDETWSFVREELATGWNAQAALVAGRQARIAAANARLESAHVEGVGQHVASIDLMAWTDWERRNPGITGQKDWLDSLLRDNPECRVNSRSAKTQVSFAGLDFRPSEPSGVCPFPTETPSDRNTETLSLAS